MLCELAWALARFVQLRPPPLLGFGFLFMGLPKPNAGSFAQPHEKGLEFKHWKSARSLLPFSCTPSLHSKPHNSHEAPHKGSTSVIGRKFALADGRRLQRSTMQPGAFLC